MNRDRRNIQLASHRALVQRLDIFEPVFETIAAQINLLLRHRVKHEGIIGVGGVTESENPGAAGGHRADARRGHYRVQSIARSRFWGAQAAGLSLAVARRQHERRRSMESRWSLERGKIHAGFGFEVSLAPTTRVLPRR